MSKLRLERFSYRFAEQVMNSKLAIKQEVESVLTSEAIVPESVLTIDTLPQHSPFAAPGTAPTGVGGYR